MIRKNIVVLLLIAAMLALSSSVVCAYPKDNPPPQKKAFWGKGEKGRQALYKDLNLTDEQKRLLEENRKNRKEEARAMFENMKQKRSLMKEELQKENLDMTKISGINNELKELQAKMLDHRLNGILEVRKILTPEQFRKFLAKSGERRGHLKNR